MNFNLAEEFTWNLLRSKLPKYLAYHGVVHTKQVLEACLELLKLENVTEENDIILLKTAALFHDCGFVNVYDNHEEEGCKVAMKELPSMGYSSNEIEKICGMIMATKIPQSPKTHLEKILCDADLYYLGTDSFESISITLYNEWKAIDKVSSLEDYDKIQIKFLESHHYWTESAIKSKNEMKQKHLDRLKKKI